LSGNHGGDLSKALTLVEVAHQCGADAIKLQTYTPDTITVRGTDDRFLIKDGLWSGKYLHQLYAEAMTPWEWHAEIFRKANDLGLWCFSSPFDESAVDFLENSFGPPLYKIASFELNHFPLLEKIGRLKKPVLASVGVSSEVEVAKAVRTLRANGSGEIILLHCVSEYPARHEDFCLNQMPLLKSSHDASFGLSDHSLGHTIAVAATALGARVIEKHLCLDRTASSVDGGFSMLPQEFEEMTKAVESTHKAVRGTVLPQKPSFFKRSILVAEKIKSGDRLSEFNLRVARPGDGMCPSFWKDVMGKCANKDLEIGHPLCKDDFC